MKREVVIIAAIAIIAIIVALALLQQKKAPEEKYDLTGKKVIIVLFQGFQPLEYNPVRDYLSKCGAKILVLALHKDVETKYDVYIYDVKGKFSELAQEYDAIVVIGGPGVYKRVTAGEYPEVELLESLVKKFHEKCKVVAAICAAPAVLARAGILKGVKATCFPDAKLISILKENGAHYVDQGVVVSGNIITARGPPDAHEFAKAVARKLAGA